MTGVDATLHEAQHNQDSTEPKDMNRGNEAEYNFCGNRARSYSHLKTQVASNEWGETHMNQGHIMESGATHQMSMTKGLATFGVDGHKAAKSEMMQLHD